MTATTPQRTEWTVPTLLTLETELDAVAATAKIGAAPDATVGSHLS